MAMDLQRLMSLLRQCMQRYDMVSAGDKIAVGLSGGKDSLILDLRPGRPCVQLRRAGRVCTLPDVSDIRDIGTPDKAFHLSCHHVTSYATLRQTFLTV